MNNNQHPAAEFCEALSIGGYSDWYMPAKNELEVCYYNLKPTTQSNDTGSGINPNAVPARASNYTSGTPAQTTANDFKSTGSEDFDFSPSASYWSSTETSTTAAAAGYFPNGAQLLTFYKTNNFQVRAIRRVAV